MIFLSAIWRKFQKIWFSDVESVSIIRERSVAFAACVAFIFNIDWSFVLSILPVLQAKFGVSAETVLATMSLYMLGAAFALPLTPWLSARFGARWLLSFSIIGFAITSLFCASANDFFVFLWARTAQGFFIAFSVPLSRVLVLGSVPKHRWAAANSAIIWPSLLGPLAGPAFAGWLTSIASWQWLFWINLPIALIIIFAIFSLVPKGRPADPPPFDLTGCVILSLGIILLGFVSLRGSLGMSTSIVALCWAGFAVLVCSAVYHFRHSARPLIDVTPLRDTGFREAVAGGGFFLRLQASALLALLPLILQPAHKIDSAELGISIGIFFLGNFVGCLFTSNVVKKIGFQRTLVACGSISTFLLGCLVLAPITNEKFVLLPVLLFLGIGRGVIFTTLSTSAFLELHESKRGAAAALMTLAQQVTAGLGVICASFAISMSLREGPFGIVLEPDLILLSVPIAMGLVGVWLLRLRAPAKKDGFGSDQDQPADVTA